MFFRLTLLFDEYLACLEGCNGKLAGAHSDLAAEVRERLAQLNFISEQLGAISAQFGVMLIEKRTNESGEIEHYNATHARDEHLRFLMRLLTESFYYFSFRVRQILRNEVHRFSELQAFESVGVRDVRNQLIEHPEGKNSRVFNRSFSWSQERGMQLKTGRQEWESSDFHDAGFVANASEFSQRLEAALQGAIEGLRQAPNSAAPRNDA